MAVIPWTQWLAAPARDCEGGDASAALGAFRRFVLLHGCARSWLWIAFGAELSGPAMIASALLASVAFGLAWHPRTERVAPRVALPALLVQAALSFPSTDNHFFLELYAVGLLCLAGERDDDAWLLGSLRWLAAIVLFQTGLQKVLYGQYFSGQLLAFLIGQGDRFALPFEWLVSAQEVARLQGYDPLRTGAGPYRVDSLLFVALSNGVWIAELALAPLLLLARTRLAATGAAIALVAAIQLGARELGFAFLFTSLLLLFTRQGNARALPWLGVLYLYALAAVWLGLPGGDWLDPGSL